MKSSYLRAKFPFGVRWILWSSAAGLRASEQQSLQAAQEHAFCSSKPRDFWAEP